MPERPVSEVLHKVCYINTLTTFFYLWRSLPGRCTMSGNDAGKFSKWTFFVCFCWRRIWAFNVLCSASAAAGVYQVLCTHILNTLN